MCIFADVSDELPDLNSDLKKSPEMCISCIELAMYQVSGLKYVSDG